MKLTAQIGGLPDTPRLEEEMRDLIREFGYREVELREEAQDAWRRFFRTSADVGSSGLVGVGVAPSMPLATLVTAGAAAAASLVGPDSLEALANQRKIGTHGLYYLARFGG